MAISPPAARGDIKTLTKNEAFKIISVFFKTLNASTTFFHPPFRIFLMLCLRTFNTISTSSVGGGGVCCQTSFVFSLSIRPRAGLASVESSFSGWQPRSVYVCNASKLQVFCADDVFLPCDHGLNF